MTLLTRRPDQAHRKRVHRATCRSVSTVRLPRELPARFSAEQLAQLQARLPLDRPANALDSALRWRPVVPELVIDRALRRGRVNLPAPEPDAPRRDINYTVPAIQRTREQMIRTQAIMDPPPRTLMRRTVELPNCTAEHLSLPSSRPGHVLLYFHGGGFLRGQTDTHAGALARFMRAARVDAFSVDYRLAPEDHFPSWLDDGLDAYKRLLDTGINPNRIAFGGDSAGGGLALGLIQRLREEGLPNPACAFVVSPWADMSHSGPSHTENVQSEAMFGEGVIQHTADWIVENAGLPATHPLLSPSFGHYPDAPPLRIDVSAREVLRSDGELVADAYRRDGSPVDLVIHPSAPHAWTAIGVLRAARETARDIGGFIDAHLF